MLFFFYNQFDYSLQHLIMAKKAEKKALLIILDGWGHGVKRNADAIALANPKFIHSLYQKYPNAELVTFGEEVGLPEGQMGNSEVGHMNIGAGRVVYQELTRISKSIRDGDFFQNKVLKNAFQYAKTNGKTVHLMGLVSDGGVHSHVNHVKALCDMAAAENVTTKIHAFTDGRDCDPKSGVRFLSDLSRHIENKKNINIATIIGRYYAMDRDKRWERVKLAYDLLTKNIGEKVENIAKTLENCYKNDITDEFLKPMVVGNGGKIKQGDVVISFNFRTDRPREIVEALSQKDFTDFQMSALHNLKIVTMTRYDDTYKNVEIVFEKDNLSKTLGEVIAAAGKTQVRIAETEKYPHVTFFFSGGQETPFEGERRILVASPKVATYDLQPEMSAGEITEKICADITENQPNFICLNYANTDMVGHTGIVSAAVNATQIVSNCTEKLVKTALKFNYEILIIADHGNSDYMINEDGTPNTAHTTNLVPCIYVSKRAKGKTVRNGKLADVAPTVLELLGIKQPKEMTGKSLIR
jgi:2,3-bisphosphoglycerate-independent phosphoglycerate mutase